MKFCVIYGTPPDCHLTSDWTLGDEVVEMTALGPNA